MCHGSAQVTTLVSILLVRRIDFDVRYPSVKWHCQKVQSIKKRFEVRIRSDINVVWVMMVVVRLRETLLKAQQSFLAKSLFKESSEIIRLAKFLLYCSKKITIMAKAH
jgi:hypothetical protein